MKARWVAWYARLLDRLPSGFKAEFGPEME